MPISAIVTGQGKLNADIMAALNLASSPSDLNPFVTMSDISSMVNLGDYTNVVVVDPNGNGDYLTQAEAAAAITDDDANNTYTVFVFGETADMALWGGRPYINVVAHNDASLFKLENGALVRDPVLDAASGPGALNAGVQSSATGDYSSTRGQSNQAAGDYSTAEGLGSIASGFGQEAKASGMFNNVGASAQASRFVLRRSVSHNSGMWYSLFSDGSAILPIVPAYTAWVVKVLLVGATQEIAQTWAYELTGRAVNAGGAMSVVFTRTAIFESDAAYDAQLVINGTTGALEVQVNCDLGGTQYTIRWVANLQVVEVKFEPW